MDSVFMELKGIHNFTIGVVKKRLDGKKWDNLFGSMQTNENERLTGKAITSSYGIDHLLQSAPIDVYYIFEFLSFSIRFIVGKGMIHDQERGCLFHRKVNKLDILETIKAGYISLKSRKQINKYLDLEQINSFTTLLNIISAIARSDNPEKSLSAYLTQKNIDVEQGDRRTKAFISYSHADKEWLERLQIHIKPFERKGIVDPWDDTKIEPGMPWREEIEKALNSAKVAVLLVSANFLASDFITDYELPSLLAAAKKEGTVILPVIIKPCAFSVSELAQFQSINPPSKALSGMSEHDQDQMFVKVTESITRAL
jgi:hypothetical protein